MSLWLTAEELVELTGYRTSRCQIRWLQKSRVQHFVRADGRPVVPVAALRPGVEAAAAPEQPDFDALPSRH